MEGGRVIALGNVSTITVRLSVALRAFPVTFHPFLEYELVISNFRLFRGSDHFLAGYMLLVLNRVMGYFFYFYPIAPQRRLVRTFSIFTRAGEGQRERFCFNDQRLFRGIGLALFFLVDQGV